MKMFIAFTITAFGALSAFVVLLSLAVMTTSPRGRDMGHKYRGYLYE